MLPDKFERTWQRLGDNCKAIISNRLYQSSEEFRVKNPNCYEPRNIEIMVGLTNKKDNSVFFVNLKGVMAIHDAICPVIIKLIEDNLTDIELSQIKRPISIEVSDIDILTDPNDYLDKISEVKTQQGQVHYDEFLQ
jgi:hypothetical protein